MASIIIERLLSAFFGTGFRAFRQWLQRGSEPDAEASRPVRRRQIRRRAAAAGKGLALLADFLARVSVADQGGDGNDGAAGRHGARADVGR